VALTKRIASPGASMEQVLPIFKYNNVKLLRLRLILLTPRALDLLRWLKGYLSEIGLQHVDEHGLV